MSFKWDSNPNLLLNDSSEAGQERLRIAKFAFEKFYDPTRKFSEINPTVREDWLQKVKAITAAVQYLDSHKRNLV
jgi:hypothetical protein